DASEGMLTAAAAAFPDLEFRRAALPDLAEVADGQFGNVLCWATFMHLPAEEIAGGVANLARILAPRGRLILSAGATSLPGEREPAGRLFIAIEAAQLTALLEAAGFRPFRITGWPAASPTDRAAIVALAEKQG